MTSAERKAIVRAWRDVSSEQFDNDISTERLIQMACDRATERVGWDVDVSHLLDAVGTEALRES